jgi:hypothetical protein
MGQRAAAKADRRRELATEARLKAGIDLFTEGRITKDQFFGLMQQPPAVPPLRVGEALMRVLEGMRRKVH